MKKSIIVLSAVLLVFLISGFTISEVTTERSVTDISNKIPDTTKVEKPVEVREEAKESKLKLYKKDVLATYYADKFNGRKTTSGERFHNKKYTAAHMKLPFGTKVRVTNESNGKSVDVKVNDRGPFSKKLEIDLTKAAFMEIASNKGSGSFKVKIEIIEE